MQSIANEARLRGVEVRPTGVRRVWSRHQLETRYKRLMRLESAAREDTVVLSEPQIKFSRRKASVGLRPQHGGSRPR